MQQSGPAPLPRRRLGRAAKFMFGAAALGSVAITGCGDDEVPMDTGTIAPAYGAVPVDTGVDAGDDVGPADTGPADTGGPTDGGGDGPLYGGAPDAG